MSGRPPAASGTGAAAQRADTPDGTARADAGSGVIPPHPEPHAHQEDIEAKLAAAEVEAGVYTLRLYVAGHTARSTAALTNLRRICDEHLAGRYTIEVIDLLQHPQLAAGDQILAVPTLVRHLPTPIKRIIGTLSDTDRVLVGLDLRPAG